MRNVHQVVDLGARTDTRFTYRTAVDAGVGANLYVVLEDAATYLWDLPMPLLLVDVAEAVYSDLCAAMNDAAGADDRTGIKANEILELRVGSQLAALADHSVGTDADPIAELGTSTDDGVVSYVHALTQLDVGPEHGGGGDFALSLPLWIEQGQCLGQSGMGVVDPQEGGGSRHLPELPQVAPDYDGSSASGAKIWEVFSPSKKANLSLARRLERRGSQKLATRISGQFGAKVLGKLANGYTR
jgi:hypothetical protein